MSITVFEVKLNSGAPFVTMGFDALQTLRAQLLFQGDSDFFHGFWRNPHIPADIDRNVVSSMPLGFISNGRRTAEMAPIATTVSKITNIVTLRPREKPTI